MIELWLLLRHWVDQQSFKKRQVDYFLYLRLLLQSAQGQLTMHSIFLAESRRYGATHYRGRLAQSWLLNYEQNGGDLAATWKEVLSTESWLLIRASQAQGDQALMSALEVLSEQQKELQELKQQILQLMWPAIAAVLLLVSMWVVVPVVTVPQLQVTFATVPESYYGKYTLWLFSWAKFSQQYGWVLLLCSGLVFLLIYLSLARYCGRYRDWLNHLEPWKSYKKIHSLQLVSLLALLLNNRETQLRLAQAVQMLIQDRNPWLRNQVLAIQHRILQGEVGSASFATGILSKEQQWFLQDMEQSQGIALALKLTANRQLQYVKRQLALQAHFWRWVLLLGCVFALLTIGGWHYVVIDELRRSLLMLYAS